MKPQTSICCFIITLLTILAPYIAQANSTSFGATDGHLDFGSVFSKESAWSCCTLLASAEGKRLRTRQRGDVPPLSDPWTLRIAEEGDFCYADSAEVRLWRKNDLKAAQLSIRDNTQQHGIKVRWPARTPSLAWPIERLPLQDGRSYLIDINQAITAITFHKIPADFSTNVERYRWMETHGCNHQAELLQSEEASDASSE